MPLPSRRILVPALTAAVLAPLAALAVFAAQAHADGHIDLAIKNFSFTPMNITVPRGATVVWHNQDEEPHTVVSTGGAFRSEALDTDDSFSFRFDRPGVYKYICSIHPQMTAQITVK